MMMSNKQNNGKLPVNVFPVPSGDNNMEVIRLSNYFSKFVLFLSVLSHGDNKEFP